MVSALGIAVYLTLAGGVQPIDLADPWSGEPLTIEASPLHGRAADRVDPWSGDAVAAGAASGLSFDHDDPWQL